MTVHFTSSEEGMCAAERRGVCRPMLLAILFAIHLVSFHFTLHITHILSECFNLIVVHCSLWSAVMADGGHTKIAYPRVTHTCWTTWIIHTHKHTQHTLSLLALSHTQNSIIDSRHTSWCVEWKCGAARALGECVCGSDEYNLLVIVSIGAIHYRSNVWRAMREKRYRFRLTTNRHVLRVVSAEWIEREHRTRAHNVSNSACAVTVTWIDELENTFESISSFSLCALSRYRWGKKVIERIDLKSFVDVKVALAANGGQFVYTCDLQAKRLDQIGTSNHVKLSDGRHITL